MISKLKTGIFTMTLDLQLNLLLDQAPLVRSHMFRWTHLRFLRFDEPAVTGDKFYSILRASDTFVIFFKYCFISLLRSSDNRLHSFMKKYKLNDHRECLRLLIISLNVLPISSSPSFGIVIN